MLSEMILLPSIFILIIIGVLGACVGSFLNVVIYRGCISLKREWIEYGQDVFPNIEDLNPNEKLSVSFPASHCPTCKHNLKLWHNIPIISWLFLKGKCGFCKCKISFQYPAVESIVMILFICSFLSFGISFKLLAVMIITVILVAGSGIDIKMKLLPDLLTLGLMWIGFIFNYFDTFTSLHDSVAGAFFAYSSLWILFWIFKLITGKDGMGFGDFKLYAAFGAFFGVIGLVPMILMASIINILIFIVCSFFIKTKDLEMPFGPALSISFLLYAFFGEWILSNVLMWNF